MSPLAQLLLANIVPVYFAYGLAFFCMGFAVLLESRRTSELPIARAMSLLGGFGVIHGMHEWFDMGQLLASRDNPAVYAWPAEMGRVGILALSFLLLFAFGARLTFGERHWPWGILALTAGAGLIWAVAVLVAGRSLDVEEVEWLAIADALCRYILAVPASILTAWALARQERVLLQRGLPGFGRDMVLAAVGFLLYGVVGQIFVRPTILFPSTVVNSGLFIILFGVPVQVFRALMAAVITITTIHALRAFDLESRQQLATANEARLSAQQQMLEEQARRQEETARLNEDLQAAARELTVLYDLSRILASTLELDTVLKEAVARIAHSVEPVRAASTWLMDDATGDLVLMACDGCSDPSLRARPDQLDPYALHRKLVRASMATGCTMGLYDSGATAPLIGESPRRVGTDGQRKEVWPVIVSVPLMRKDKPIGALLLEVSADEVGISSADLPLVRAMAVPLSLAVENALLYGEVKRRDADRGELLHRIVSAQEAERQRVARELHDETGQALTALALGLKGTRETLKSNPRLAGEQMDELRAETTQALDALRQLVSDLRPSQLDDLGLPAALRWYVDDFSARVPAEAKMLISGTSRRLSADVESVLFRIAQEALTNVAKHANADHVVVELEFAPTLVRLSVRDNGSGFNPAEALKHRSRRRSYGLLGMKERADLVDGRLSVESRPGGGTEVVVEVPASPVAVRHEENQTTAGR